MSCGLDTVGISFPIRGADTTGATVSVVGVDTPEARYTYRRKLAGGGFMAWGVGDFVWAEASLPKRVNEDNIEALDPVEAVEVIRGLYDEVAALVDVDTQDHVYSSCSDAPRFRHRSWETARVVRADLVRDFDGVTAVAPLLNGLSTIRQPGRHKVRRYADAERSNAETLRVGPKSWSCTLYDKHAETKGAADPGRLRFEARLRSRQLLSKHAHKLNAPIATVLDLTPEKVRTMTHAHFHSVGFDREVSGIGQVAARINETDLNPRVKRELVGYLAARAMGVDLAFSSNTERKYRTLAADLGLVLTQESLEDTFTAQLDFDAGTQVLTASAA